MRMRACFFGVFFALFLTVFRAAPTSAGAPAGQDPRETRAIELFGASHYEEALDIYMKLHVETQHPVYLRNIGRCHQNLGHPDEAISAFREYLAKAKNLDPKKQAQIDGYIKEMEELKAK